MPFLRVIFISALAVSLCFFKIVLVPYPCTMASTTMIAVTGNAAPGVANAEFGTLFASPVNDHGEIVFTAHLKLGPGGVGSGDDAGVWLFDGTATTLVAREGSASVPDVPDANFQSFSPVAIDNSGDVAFRATLENSFGGVTSTNDQGIWRYSGGAGTLMARTGATDVPDVVGADFASLPATLRIAGDGRIAHNGILAIADDVIDTNDRGVWSYQNGIGTLLARETISSVPGVPSATFNTFGAPSINSNDQVVFGSTMYEVGGVTASNRSGIWQYTAGSGALLARIGVGNVPDVVGADFEGLGDPRQNIVGQVAFDGTLNVANNRGVWLYTNGTGELLGRNGVGGVPGVPSANFNDFQPPLLNDAGQVLVKAELEVGPGGVTTNDNSGLWFLDGTGSLAIRTGSGGVPELPGANFLDIMDFSLNENGLVAIVATLEDGVGGVDTSNDSGIWTIDPSSNSRLVAREGDMLAGRTIASLSFVGGSSGNDDQPSGFNDSGNLVFAATFTNGDSGLFLFEPLNADFNSDTKVDDEDLLAWEAGFGLDGGATPMQGDADRDLDVDGADFLTWQIQFGRGVPSLVIAGTVPEPTTWMLLSTGIINCLVGSRRRK